MSADELSVREVVAVATWDSIDDKGIRGRLYREDCDYLAGVALDALTDPTVQAGMAEVLAAHPDYWNRDERPGGWYVCDGCGVEIETSPARVRAEFSYHQAAAVVAWLTGEGAS